MHWSDSVPRVSERTSHVTNEAGNHFLDGEWRPAGAELDETGLAVVGDLPEALRGRFIRNGPNPMFEGVS